MQIDTTGLLEPQFKHVERLVDSLYVNGHAVDMSETGTGKTYAAAAVIRELNRPFAVICPKSVIHQWQKILASFKLKAVTVINYEKIGRGNTKYMKWKKLQDPMQPFNENAKREMPEFKFEPNTLVVVDEGHKCKGSDTSNSWMLVALKVQGYKVLVSSATVATSPLEMRAFGFMTNLHALYNFRDFCRVHGAELMARYGAMTFNLASAEAQQAMLRLNEYLFDNSKCASRMKVEDFGKQFPESHIVAEAYDLGSNESKIQAVYDDMEAELAKLEEKAENYSEHIFAVMMEARRKAELCKVPLFVEMVEDLYDEGKSVVLFLNFTDSVDAVVKRLSKISKFNNTVGFIVGGQSDKARQADIDAFQADKKRILVVNIAAGGTGVSLHDLNGNFPRASIISPNWSAYNMRQALGRIWRLEGKTKSYQRVVYAAKCIEENICHRVQHKLTCLDTLNDGDLAESLTLV
jgi:superfamily II DNA or RNA helicase